MKHSEILKYVKKHMGESDYLCIYLEYDFHCETKRDKKKVNDILNLISDRIGGYGSPIQYWLVTQGCITEQQAEDWDNELFYDYRQRWIDSLIKEYEEVGK